MNFSFDDVLILPQFSTVKSRQEVSTRVELAGDGLTLGVISSNMDTVTGANMSKAVLHYGGQACLHRFQSIEDNIKMLEEGTLDISEDEIYRPWVSVGVGELELKRAEALYASSAKTFVLDVAHGANMEVVKQTKALRELIGKHHSIVVGNFATGQSIKDFLFHLGNTHVDAIKVGIGGGSACTTRVVTGCGAPTFSSVVDCVSVGVPIIADGGMRNSGDVAKALAAGAKAVMLGGMLAGTDESPGELFYIDGMKKLVKPEDFLIRQMNAAGTYTLLKDKYSESFKKVKQYRGSASKESYEIQGKEASHRTPEGSSFNVPYKGPVEKVLQEIEAGVRSAMSYVGAFTVEEFKNKAKFIQISTAGMVESGPHGKL